MPDPMHGDARPRSPADDSHIDSSTQVAKQAMMGPGAAVTQQRARPAGQYGRHPSSRIGDPRMANCIDATMSPRQPAHFNPVLDRRSAEPEISKLPKRHHAMLPRGQLRNRGLHGSKMSVYMALIL